jgi:hypothetical protein
MNNPVPGPEHLQQEYPWAVKIVQRHFGRGIEQICDPKFLGRRYVEFQRKDDPIYAELLRSMGDEPLAKTFVSYWTIAQTLATRSRFWLEAAIAEIITNQARNSGRTGIEVYSHAMLRERFPENRSTIGELRGQELEGSADSAPWRVPIQRNALRAIDLLVGEQEREERPTRRAFRPRQRSDGDNLLASQRDGAQLARVVESLQGPPSDPTNLQCNLLVIHPNKPDGEVSAWAIRFVNPKTLTQHATRKQERVNLLRLYALLVQEKVKRVPQSIQVCVAELVPRNTGWDSQDHYPDYFSPVTYWSNDRLWDFIGVPFGVVQVAIRGVAEKFRDRLKDGLRNLLPGAEQASNLSAGARTLFDLG